MVFSLGIFWERRLESQYLNDIEHIYNSIPNLKSKYLCLNLN